MSVWDWVERVGPQICAGGAHPHHIRVINPFFCRPELPFPSLPAGAGRSTFSCG